MQPAFIHKINPLNKLVIIAFLQFYMAFATAADLAREQRIAEQISDAILEGEVLHLKSGATEFLGIYTRTEQQPARGAALILHGRGANPDWVDIVHPLRTQLPEHGWDTLAIQLPVASEGAHDAEWAATIPESLPRLSAALAFLKQQDIQNIVLISHSFGTHTAARYLAENKPGAILAWVGVGMPIDASGRDTNTLAMLRKIKVPVLDLYGERDLVSVTMTADKRRQAAREAGNKGYEQREVAGADHFFSGQQDLLVSIVRAWMAKVAGTGSNQPD